MAYKKITAFKCANAGCRNQPVSTERAAISHDEKCIYSLENRTCATCVHDFGPGPGDGCAVNARGDKPLVRLCDKWELA
ncbi:hypothetical protein UAM5_00060 [Ralstonia phage UAM5]|nr:hypothetical protein UAM5_00060 [Ralstonia phage UAM5]